MTNRQETTALRAQQLFDQETALLRDTLRGILDAGVDPYDQLLDLARERIARATEALKLARTPELASECIRSKRLSGEVIEALLARCAAVGLTYLTMQLDAALRGPDELPDESPDESPDQAPGESREGGGGRG